jgi:hypothetical protein
VSAPGGRTYLGVLLEYERRDNPEPGVPRAPTFGEQARAMERLVAERGGALLASPYVARQGQGIAVDVLDVLRSERCAGIVIFAIDALRRGTLLDAPLVGRLHAEGLEIVLLIEGMTIGASDDVVPLLDMLHVVNAVRERDRSSDWQRLVEDRAAS